jgi:hypothetical protein
VIIINQIHEYTREPLAFALLLSRRLAKDRFLIPEEILVGESGGRLLRMLKHLLRIGRFVEIGMALFLRWEVRVLLDGLLALGETEGMG